MSTALVQLQHWDETLLLKINALSRRDYVKITFCLITKLGDGWFFALIVFALLTLNFSKNLDFALSTALTFAIELPLFWLLKNRIKRSRPPEKLFNFHSVILPPDKFSFPSGHTASSFLVWAQMQQFVPHLAPYMLILAILIGASRVILGVHFPGDVLVGACLGTAFSYAIAITVFL